MASVHCGRCAAGAAGRARPLLPPADAGRPPALLGAALKRSGVLDWKLSTFSASDLKGLAAGACARCARAGVHDVHVPGSTGEWFPVELNRSPV